jgi:LysM repeat protein
MADKSSRSPLRLLAPVALVVFGVLFLIVVAAGLGGGSEDKPPSEKADTSTAASTKLNRPKAPKPKQPATYTIKAGDNLGTIAEKTKVPVEKLQELNPELDAQTLVSGQKIKLRE